MQHVVNTMKATVEEDSNQVDEKVLRRRSTKKRKSKDEARAISPDVSSAAKVAQNKLAVAFGDYVKNFVRETKDSATAVRMSNRIGILINEANIPKLLEDHRSTKERFKAIVENPSDDVVALDKKKVLADVAALDSKVRSLRLTKNLLKQALAKKYHMSLATKIIDAFNETTSNMFSMSLPNYLAMLQENLLTQTPVKAGLVVPKYFKLFFNLLDHGNKGYVCEHDLFEFM